MRTHKCRLPIRAAVLSRGQERTQIVMEPQKNARNIPATVISCQDKNLGRFNKRGSEKKSCAGRRLRFTTLRRKWVSRDCKSLATSSADPVSFAVYRPAVSAAEPKI